MEVVESSLVSSWLSITPGRLRTRSETGGAWWRGEEERGGSHHRSGPTESGREGGRKLWQKYTADHSLSQLTAGDTRIISSLKTNIQPGKFQEKYNFSGDHFSLAVSGRRGEGRGRQPQTFKAGAERKPQL